jgi:predicted DNA-binding transcriptional regulator AlpA
MEQAAVEKLVTARIVSEAMGMAQSQVYRLAKLAKIPSFQVGAKQGGVRFDLREVREALRRPVREPEQR